MTHNFPLTFLALNVFSLISGSLDVFIEQNMMSLGKPFQHHNIVEAGSNISVFDSFFFFVCVNTASTNAVLSTKRGDLTRFSSDWPKGGDSGISFGPRRDKNQSLGFPTKQDSYRSLQLQRLAGKSKFRL